MKIAILDDYQNVALQMADWAPLQESHTVDVFHDHVAEREALIERLYPYDILCVMRERTPLTAEVVARLPNLKLVCSTGPANASIDRDAVSARGITVMHTRYDSTAAIEATLALLFSVARHIPQESGSVRAGRWQTALGSNLRGKTLGILGLGNIGSGVAKIGRALGMSAIAWSQNLTRARAESEGATYVSRDELFRQSDFLCIHLILSKRTKGLVGAGELGAMKKSAYLINTSRGAIIDEPALIQALESGQIAGAALDTFITEPLPTDHPFRRLPNVIATPHIGFVSDGLYRMFFEDTVANVRSWLGTHD
jgi:phosphoglycerate dehydrogenase-like enzyme